MRTKNSINNLIISISLSIVTMLLGLIAQKVFIHVLGTEYLGLNSLFSSLISILALLELGIGTSVYYHLYKPLAEGNTSKIKSILKFYKKSYRIISAIVFLVGLAVIPFLGLIVGKTNIKDNIDLIYILFLIKVLCDYILTYKRSILYADQKNSIISLVHIGYFITTNVAQIIFLLLTRNYYLYLLIAIAVQLIESLVLITIANRKYPYIKEIDIEPIDDFTRKDIFIKVKASAYHKVGEFIVIGTDNIIISVFLGIAIVGKYSNYALVVAGIVMLIGQAFSVITASIGNLLVAKNVNKSFEVYKKLRLANFWLSTFAATSFLVIMNSFVDIWVGSKYILGIGVLLAVTINLYSTLMRSSIGNFKNAAAIYHEDRHVPIIESIVNIVLAIIFVHFLGLAGVILATIISTLLLHLYSYPKFVYRRLFQRSYSEYYNEFIKYLVLAIIIASITFGISRLITIDNKYLLFITNVFICLLVPNIILFAIYRKNNDFQYFINLGKKIIR